MLAFFARLTSTLADSGICFRMAVVGLFFSTPLGEIDIIGGNLADVQHIQNIIAVEEAEQLVCRPVV